MWHVLLDRHSCTGQVCPRGGQSVPGVGLPSAECGLDREGWRNFLKGMILNAFVKRPGLVLRKRGIVSEYPRDDVKTRPTWGRCNSEENGSEPDTHSCQYPAMCNLGRTTNTIAEDRTYRPSARRVGTVLEMDCGSM